ncbi:hypothetical protein PR202_ga02495 [Eleusine coracana subsp. coracana]|uniref:Uncharacterized protein n=1 Tax=Eleusine coracana subsp. coracana TaxID=191504 RepID=A0AAV5BLU9_ELECO|nr:hypothetical protein PR202_ga02495 [Eleusine coracana subsp. coracana]
MAETNTETEPSKDCSRSMSGESMEEDASSGPTMISTEKIRRERRRTAGRRRSILLGSQFEKPKPKGDPWVVPSLRLNLQFVKSAINLPM